MRNSPGNSGKIATTVDTGIVNQRLCSATFDTRAPVVLEVSVTAEGPVDSGSVGKGFELCAAAQNPGDLGSGYIILEYGSGAAYETIYLDLRSGSFQLPPSDEVRVAVSTFHSGTFLPKLGIGGTLVQGSHTAPATPTYTWRDEALSVVSGGTVWVPPRARYVDIWLANLSGTNQYGSGAPILSLVGDAAQAQLIRDYTTGIWAPPFPVPLITAGSFDGPEAFRFLTARTTVICAAVVQFVLEL